MTSQFRLTQPAIQDIEPYRLVVPLMLEKQLPQSSEVSPLPGNLAEHWGAMLEAAGLLLP
jgi:hypothetical protein